MLIQQNLFPENLQLAEIMRLNESGIDTGEIKNRIDEAIQTGVFSQFEETFWRELEDLSRKPSRYYEPSDWETIQQLKPSSSPVIEIHLDEETLFDRIYGAWLGRCAGCVLGKPVENWHREKIEAYLNSVNAYPLTSYIPQRTPFLEGLHLNPCHLVATLGNIHFMPRDDDIDYTILGLHILETYGKDFTSDQVALATINNLPFNLVYTAEAIAYRNLINGLLPPKTASFHNPYQEWIGAQIRADVWGYTNPGNPLQAAEWAYRDALYTHTGIGIYGEMWAAACIAAAFVEEDPQKIILAGLNEIPRENRLTQAIIDTLNWLEKLNDWRGVWELIQSKYGHYHPIHIIPNTCFIVMGLITGEGNFEKSICNTVMAGGDTDCTGATVGSIIGAICGSKNLPEKWIAPLNDRVKSLILNFQDVKISDLAKQTVKIINSDEYKR